RGWRHVVPSPDPKNICDLPLIASLAKQNHVVIACGGGGIPVVRKLDGTRKGVQAVIDKDLTSALIANSLGIETIMFLTAIPKVALFFGTPKQQWIDEMDLAELQKLYVDGHFPPGSMGPKMKAVIRFLEGGGKRAIITNLENVLEAFNGNNGTHLVK
ncbi:carbamate kinase, partial [Candidatus Poribacteria bacterium]|nr:carbamate kinase [Candidatus Poribacteria bacterium]